MLGGLATLAGAVAVIFAARIGSNTFGEWKRQKQEERRMDTAERILTLAYLLKYNFESVRAPLVQAYELAAAEKDLDTHDPGWSSGKSDEEKSRVKLGQASLNRLKRHNEDWDRIWTLKPWALAFFGPDLVAHLHVFWVQYVAVSTAAEAYAQDDGSDPAFSKNTRRDLWRTSDENDRVKAAIERALSAIEAELLPILRS